MYLTRTNKKQRVIADWVRHEVDVVTAIETFSVHVVVMALPIALYEMILAGWLIVRGFNYETSTVAQKYQMAGQ